MADEKEETKEPRNEDVEALKDLDIDQSQAESVKGGRPRRTEDPCAGGE